MKGHKFPRRRKNCSSLRGRDFLASATSGFPSSFSALSSPPRLSETEGGLLNNSICMAKNTNRRHVKTVAGIFINIFIYFLSRARQWKLVQIADKEIVLHLLHFFTKRASVSRRHPLPLKSQKEICKDRQLRRSDGNSSAVSSAWRKKSKVNTLTETKRNKHRTINKSNNMQLQTATLLLGFSFKLFFPHFRRYHATDSGGWIQCCFLVVPFDCIDDM